MARQSASSDAQDTHVLLLRGINVSGKNRLPMQVFAALLSEAGCTDVRTYIQSGNAIVRAAPALARRLPAQVATALAERFGVHVPVVLRTAAELRAVAEGNPFLAAGADAASLHVAFLAEVPSPERVAALDPARSPGDAFQVRGRDIYLHLPNGVARSKLTNSWFDSQLGTVSTVRNWRTVLTLREMAGG